MTDQTEIEMEILSQAARRGPGKTLCPSEVARALADSWRPLMPQVREAAARLAADGRIAILQKGRRLPGLPARGPIRLGLTEVAQED